eukprot:scaffold44161_cov78-Phaeocystis_antarctica.AAC.3
MRPSPIMVVPMARPAGTDLTKAVRPPKASTHAPRSSREGAVRLMAASMRGTMIVVSCTMKAPRVAVVASQLEAGRRRRGPGGLLRGHRRHGDGGEQPERGRRDDVLHDRECELWWRRAHLRDRFDSHTERAPCHRHEHQHTEWQQRRLVLQLFCGPHHLCWAAHWEQWSAALRSGVGLPREGRRPGQQEEQAAHSRRCRAKGTEPENACILADVVLALEPSATTEITSA